jgi:hypothetical protein
MKFEFPEINKVSFETEVVAAGTGDVTVEVGGSGASNL